MSARFARTLRHKIRWPEDLPERFSAKYPCWEWADFLTQIRDSRNYPKRRRLAAVAEKFKSTMRRFPHPAVVVTAMSADSRADTETGPGTQLKHFRGALVSSMNSVTVGEPAYISFNLSSVSGTLRAIKETTHFTVHLLEANVAGADLASRFFKRSHSATQISHLPAWDSVARTHKIGVLKRRSFKDNNYRSEAPLISGPGVAGYLHCQISSDHPAMKVGNHVIVVARVLNCLDPISSSEPSSTDASSTSLLLSYSDGNFKNHGSTLRVPDPPVPAPTKSPTDVEAEGARKEISAGAYDKITDFWLTSGGRPILHRAAEVYMEDIVLKLQQQNAPRNIVETLQRLRIWAESVLDLRVSVAASLLTHKILRSLQEDDAIAVKSCESTALIEKLDEVLAGPDKIDNFFNLYDGLAEMSGELLELSNWRRAVVKPDINVIEPTKDIVAPETDAIKPDSEAIERKINVTDAAELETGIVETETSPIKAETDVVSPEKVAFEAENNAVAQEIDAIERKEDTIGQSEDDVELRGENAGKEADDFGQKESDFEQKKDIIE